MTYTVCSQFSDAEMMENLMSNQPGGGYHFCFCHKLVCKAEFRSRVMNKQGQCLRVGSYYYNNLNKCVTCIHYEGDYDVPHSL